MIAKYEDGDRFEGYVKDGEKCGKGRYTFKDGGSYIGDWNSDLKDGFGVL